MIIGMIKMFKKGFTRAFLKKMHGFTLIEMIVYVAIFALVMMVVTSFVFQILSVKNRSKAARETYQEARYILERINSKIRYAPGVDTGNSMFDSDQGVLILKSQVARTNLTEYRLTDEIVTEKIGDLEENVLNSNNVRVTQLKFEQIVSSDVQSSIKTTIIVTYQSGGRKDLEASSTLTANASLRNNYPYEWEQTNWIGGPGQDQWSNPTMYVLDDTNFDTKTCEGDLMLGTDKYEIVIHANDACATHGFFHKGDDSAAADGILIEDMPDLGLRVGGHFGNAAENNPEHYTDFGFSALANTDYHVWARLKVVATGNAGTSDSLYIQFSDSVDDDGLPMNQIGGSEGLVVSQGSRDWGWNDIWTGIENRGEIFKLENSVEHILRLQRREDGFAFDQVVISASAYMSSSPASGTIVPKKYQTSAELTSSAFDSEGESVFGQLIWTAYTPPNTSVKLQLRTADTFNNLIGAPWLGPNGAQDYYTQSGAGINSDHDGDEWIQYRVFLSSTNNTITPVLSAVTVSYSK